MKSPISFITVVLSSFASTAIASEGADPFAGLSAETLSVLPDPLRMSNGGLVTSAEDWRRRRAELIDVLLRIEYGRMPPAPGNVTVTSATDWQTIHEGVTRFREVHLAMGPGLAIPMTLEMYFPAAAASRVPTIVRIGLGCPIIPEINRQGCGFVCFDHRTLEPDTEGYDLEGAAQKAYPDYDWGSLAVWAWGASRVMDYLGRSRWVHPQQVAITGHSRTGKAALLAGALDERFAMVAPNGSGCGGAACYRIQGPGCETLELITRPSRFAGWFQKDFRRFAGKERDLPFDQHWLRARPLSSPRSPSSTCLTPGRGT